MALLSYHTTLPDSAPFSSYRSGREFLVWKYDQALRAFRERMERSGTHPKEFALHSVRIGAASSLAAGGGNVSIQQEGRWRPEEYKTEDARRVSRKLSDKERRSRDSRGGCTM